ncbi:restriction endonuclease subunit S [uncultured Pseudoteredinibacter sp.]|uniref:restriction endonuclease subunit S n=1 Tax=uncultured Pseudoteredinibacter sp. TaxID=1641701 RepID=UPI002623F879|nr:restriction endonuclease subunit S [uncultured Pseudoteredinibacter sp.]
MSELPRGWVNTELDNLFSFVIGGDWGKDPGFSDTDFDDALCIRGSEFKKWHRDKGSTASFRKVKQASLEKRKLELGDILIEISGGGPDQPVGRTVLIDDLALSHNPGVPKVCTNFLRLARPSKKIDSRYLNYYLHSFYLSGEVVKYQGGSNNLRNLKFKEYSKINIPLAPLNEQIRIANNLDSILAKVDKAQTRLEKIPLILKRFRQSVLAAATSGELTKEWRNENFYSTSEMLKELVKPKKPARYKSRNIGFIEGVVATAVGKPNSKLVDSWEWVPLVDIAVMGTGHTPSRSKSEYWGGEVNWIGIKDARNNHTGTILETEQKTNELGLENSAARILPKDTVCISRTASVGYVVKMGVPMATSQDFVTWTPTDVLDPDWLKWLFVSEKESLFRFGKGTTHTTVYFPEWLSMHVALPPIEEQKEIVRQVESLFSLADDVAKKYHDSKQRTDRLTQSILAKAFRGELLPQDPSDEPAEVLLESIKSVVSKPKAKSKR